MTKKYLCIEYTVHNALILVATLYCLMYEASFHQLVLVVRCIYYLEKFSNKNVCHFGFPSVISFQLIKILADQILPRFKYLEAFSMLHFSTILLLECRNSRAYFHSFFIL